MQKTNKKISINVRFSQDLYERLHECAHIERMSKAEFIKVAILKSIEKTEKNANKS